MAHGPVVSYDPFVHFVFNGLFEICFMLAPFLNISISVAGNYIQVAKHLF